MCSVKSLKFAVKLILLQTEIAFVSLRLTIYKFLPLNIPLLLQQEWWLFHTWDPAHDDLAEENTNFCQ